MSLVKICLIMFAFQHSTSCETKTSCETPLGEKSHCVKLTDCNPMVEFLNNAPKPFPSKVVKAFNQFVCQYGKEITDTLICCPSQSIKINEEINLVGPPPTPPSVENHENLKYLPEECGLMESPNDKITGGENATLKEFPWMALLLYRKGERLVPNCGGSILNENYILTAAHCVVDTPSPFVGIRVGEYSLLSEKDCVKDKQKQQEQCLPPVQHLIPIRIITHPDYSSDSNVNDIALIKVTKMNFADNVQPICLPTHQEILNQEFSYGVVTGWGYLDPLNSKTVDVLQKINLKRQNMTVCTSAYKMAPRKKVSDNSYNRLCIGGEIGKDSCGGDSGGPFQTVADFNDEERYIQRGIVSIGHIECGKTGFPAIYTNVEYYMKWILDNIEA